jgi:translation initiation factor IF-2
MSNDYFFTMNISELARQVKISTADLRLVLPVLGFDVGARAIKVDNKIAQAVIKKLRGPAKQKFLQLVAEPRTTAVKTMEKPDGQAAGKTLIIPAEIVVKELARKINIDVTKLVAELMKEGVMASLNDRIDFETAAIVADDLGYKVVKESMITPAVATEEEETYIKSTSGVPRPPVVVVMGHVDHGKTKLLDAIRKTDVAAGEAGGITQHIGAYQVEERGQLITFIDTPGHEAFSLMRSRGARVADLAILVVAADDGVQPQTIEALSHIRRANLPFLVAINKMDKNEANPDKVKKELSELGVTPEEWSGETMMVEVAAKTSQNIKSLLTALKLLYSVHKDSIRVEKDGPVVGTIIESHVNPGSGPVATVLVRSGTLKLGGKVLVNDVVGKVRSMSDWHGQKITQAEPSTPVSILGLKTVPRVGDILRAVTDTDQIRSKQRSRKKKGVRPGGIQKQQAAETEVSQAKMKINIFIKADVLGTQEAVSEGLERFNTDDVQVVIVGRGLGLINETDVLRADDSGALILGFNTYATTEAEELARTKTVQIKSSGVIYDLFDFLEETIGQQLQPEVAKNKIGRLKVLKVFRQEKDKMVLGGEVLDGKIVKGVKVEKDNNETQETGELLELQSGKEVVSEVVVGQQAGLAIKGLTITPGEILSFYQEKEIKRKIKSDQ